MYDEKRRNGELAAARSDGRAEAEVEMAKKLKVLGIDFNTIVQATGLNREAVEKL